MADVRRVALVTGGGRGLGRAISTGLADDGFDVAVNFHRDMESAAETVALVEARGGRAVALPAAVESAEEDAALVDAVIAEFGHLDAFVHNAGVSNRGRTVADTDPADLERVMGVHALGAHHLCRLVVPHLRAQERSDVVLISSQSTRSHDPNAAPYTMAKAALEALAYSLANEEARHGIRVNVVAAGLMNTDMGRKLVKGVFGLDDVHALDDRIALGQVAEPDDVAQAVRFLVSERGGLVTGQRIAVDGGSFS